MTDRIKTPRDFSYTMNAAIRESAETTTTIRLMDLRQTHRDQLLAECDNSSEDSDGVWYRGTTDDGHDWTIVDCGSPED